MHVHPKIAWGELDQGRDERDRRNNSLVRTSAAIGAEDRSVRVRAVSQRVRPVSCALPYVQYRTEGASMPA
jgi:hypothetical protein